MTQKLIYHVCKQAEWDAAIKAGSYAGSSQDQADGFIHFSGPETVRESTAKHRAGQDGLLLLIVDSHLLGGLLKWEPSRRGILFPHLYGELPLTAVVYTGPVTLGADGIHIFPARFEAEDND